jgi:hypothetical protein
MKWKMVPAMNAIAGRLVMRNLISNESIQPAAKSETCHRMSVLCRKGKHILPLVHFTLTTHPAVICKCK